MGGSGKTTLAQYVYEFERKKIEENNDKHFDIVIWAHVSQQFSIPGILKKIWESAFKEPCPNFSCLEGLRSKLGEKLQDQKFFLVLDDVWCDKGISEEELEQLFAAITSGKRGSKILVTTRIEEAAKALGDINPIPLRELDEDQFFSLFMSNALGNAQITGKHLDELTLIGQKIAEKLHRSPLAAKTVGGQLRRRLDTEFWSSMLTRSLLNDTMGALFLSYQHLPSALQRCFAFCSLYPKGHLFWHDDLVNLWIAEGFIETEDSIEHLRETATRYILELVSCSFFKVDESYSNCYSMHDLMHDLAEHVCQSECFKIERNEEKEIPTQTRHLWVASDMLGQYVEKICKLKDLCTIVGFGWNSLLKEVDLEALFTNLRKLRRVDLQHIKSLPKSVIELKNLRYLKIHGVDGIPDSVLESLNKLYQLRILRIEKNNSWEPIDIPNVGRLVLLQDLSQFHVRKKKGSELKQLEHLADLYGSLSIYGLHNVERKEEAQQVKLSDKKGLRELRLYFKDKEECFRNAVKILRSNDVQRDREVEILDYLCPPPQIEELYIRGYSGKRFPNWIITNRALGGSQQGLNSLVRLQLEDIRTIACITDEVLCSLASLRKLCMFDCLFLTSIDGWDTHNALERLYIQRCPNLTLKASLVAISSKTGEQSSSCKRRTTPSVLNYVSLWICSPLDDCLQNLASLETLLVESCPTIANPHIGNSKSLAILQFVDCSNLISVRGLSELNHLVELKMRGCEKIKCYSGPDKLPRLRNLAIHKVSLIEQIIIRDGLSHLVSLKLYFAKEEYFSQQECEVFSFLPSLETIEFTDCQIRMLPSLLGLHTLKSVTIEYCQNLTSLQEMPPSVRSITIQGCNKDFTDSCRDPESPNWQKISHIPEKNIERY